ncbi:MAG: hypothetical protein AAGF95_16095 [Chloroflexota bacterium]
MGKHSRISSRIFLLSLLLILLVMNPPARAESYDMVLETQSDTMRIDTSVIESFNALQLTSFETYSWPSGPSTSPYTFFLSEEITAGVQISDLLVEETGSGTCTQLSNGDIRCSGSIDSLMISYRKVYTPRMYPPAISLDAGGFESVGVNYTYQLLYPDTLNYIGATEEPATHDVAERTLTWTEANMRDYQFQVLFADVELKGQYLPLIQR